MGRQMFNKVKDNLENRPDEEYGREIEGDLIKNLRELLRELKKIEHADVLLDKLVHTSPRSVASIRGLDLPISVTHFVDSATRVTLLTDVNEPLGEMLEKLLCARSFLFLKLLTTPEDEKKKKKYKKEMMNRLLDTEMRIEQLERSLNDTNERNKAEMRKTEKVVKQLETEINNLNLYIVGKVEIIHQEESQTQVKMNAAIGNRMKDLEAKLSQLTDSFRKTVEANQKEEKKQRSTIYKEELALEGIISKYDQEMLALQEEYDTLDEEYTNEKRELNELEEKFWTLEEEYLQIMEEKRIEEERKKREEEDRRALEEAVTTIQAFWRSYKTRKSIRGKRGKKRGK